ncbi:MAG: hypothetical protein IJ174_01985 [Clostridia bacterium]|nr:hypothetical protein [Clostridia bacterium]
MKNKRFLLAATLILMCALTGCAPEGNEPKEDAPAHVVATDVPAAEGSPLGFSRVLEPYRSMLSKVPLDAASAGYLIPQEIFTQAERDFAAFGYSEDNGFLTCEADTSNVKTYEANGMNSASATMTPEEMREDLMGDGDMDTSLMGDWEHLGGGTYTRTAAYAISKDLSAGSVTLETGLNGIVSSQERFRFAVENGVFRFLDMTYTATDFDEDGGATEQGWLITFGVLERNQMNVVEYPSAEALEMVENLSDYRIEDFLAMPGAVQVTAP